MVRNQQVPHGDRTQGKRSMVASATARWFNTGLFTQNPIEWGSQSGCRREFNPIDRVFTG
ncbi:MAG: hypothetical protein M3Y56_03885 [Armatimonadota bacterium]|nr:hypothetical protein [Armatimonadota bacterium]